jgi:glucose/arabinose dehydrogenase
MRYADGKLGAPHVILKGIAKSVHHNGGGLTFGPGGMLYVSTGDAENPANAQNKHSLSGKILRITPTGKVPGNNPFGNHTWTYGHRNPEHLKFGPKGVLWASEFGDKRKDELNRIVRGANYGWPEVEGKDGPGGYHDPLAQWDTDQCSPSGIAILGGRAWLGALQGECVYSVRLSGRHRGRKQRYFTGKYGRIRDIAAAPDGSLWVSTSNRDGRANPGPHDDRIFRVAI